MHNVVGGCAEILPLFSPRDFYNNTDNNNNNEYDSDDFHLETCCVMNY